MKIKALPAEERPMEKGLFGGMESLSNAELLALILNTGTREQSAIALAEELISFAGGLGNLSDFSGEELIKVKGIGKGKAARLLAALELGKRVSSVSAGKNINVNRTEEVARIFMEDLRYMKKEFFKVLLLNSKGDVMAVETVSIGELSNTIVHPREAFRMAVKKSAAAVIFVHNHPSGDPTPSRDDILTTRRLIECGQLLGIKVLDHIVIGNGNFVSINEVCEM